MREIADRIRHQARVDARRIARWESIAYTVLILSVALWVVVEAAVGALTRSPA